MAGLISSISASVEYETSRAYGVTVRFFRALFRMIVPPSNKRLHRPHRRPAVEFEVLLRDAYMRDIPGGGLPA